jgi:NitT/TauT family transport system permease protein
MPAKGNKALRIWQLGLFAALLAAWYVLTSPTLLPPLYFDDPNKAAFFFGEPLKVAGRIWDWFSSGFIYPHLWVTLVETALAFVIGTVLGLVIGLWLALSPTASALLDPYLKAVNSMPRVILAPIFAMWFGLDMGSKVALGVTLVFFIVFFNVYQGVREVSHTVLANARMLGANERQLLRHVYVPSAMSWVFASLHNSVGLAFVGAVVGEYLGSSRGVGYLILQAEGAFDINTVMAGILVLTAFALALDAGVGRIERRLMRWQPAAGETEKL